MNTRKKTLMFLLVAAFLIAGVVAGLTLLGSAGEPVPEMKDFSYQTVTGHSLSSESTDLRFLFTVGSLGYTRVGFVLSKTNSNPTIGAGGCTVYETTSVHSAVRANNQLIPAPGGRYWVAVKVSNIPNASFGTPIYIRPFVEDGQGVRYLDARDITACGAFGHDNLVRGRILVAPTAENSGRQEAVCDRCGDIVTSVDVNDYNATIATLQSDIEDFEISDFASGSVRTDLGRGTNYNYLAKHPTQGQHPRVMFTESEIPGIRTALENASQTVSTNNNWTVKEIFEDAVLDPVSGLLDPARERSNGTGFNNFSGEKLRQMQMLALDYQLTGNKLSGYRAIRELKNYLMTMDFQSITSDQCRYFGLVMYYSACIYDWCHDLLTSSDKEQIVLAVQKKCCEGSNSSGARMEVGFPPSLQNAVSGHGCEFQILRDYLAFAIAIYDEYPGWWNYIAERVYDEFVPVRNTWYEAGMVPQGASLYVRLRFTSDLYSALLLKAATGENPYNDGMRQVMHTVYAYELSKVDGMSQKGMFQSGDDRVGDDGDAFKKYGYAALLASHLYGDGTLRAQLEYNTWSYSRFSNDGEFTYMASVGEYLICSSSGVTAAGNRHDGEPLILYSGGWLGQIIAHDSWGKNRASVLMKIGCRTAANHDHADAGQFQIWYKGMLAGDTGSYDVYGDTHFTYYHQATVAHNSILIKKGSGTYDVGGQKQPSETGTYNVWLGDTYKTGTVTGYQYGYSDQAENTPAYAYIAGDITPAYDNSRATEVTRRMLTVYDTADQNEELYFFVFDNIAATSGSYKKTFLLHVPADPTIVGNKVTVVNQYGAKLVLQNVFGGDTITKIGGANQNYKVNGYQLTPTNSGNDGFWGRVEISPNTGNATDQLLNVMYVCDEDDPTDLTATAISNETVKGAVLGNTAAVFLISATRRTTSFEFENGAAAGNYKYYISGVAAGDWNVSVDGAPVGIARATEEGGLLTFTAPAGTVTLTPRGDAGLMWNDALGDNDWAEFDFSTLH